MTTKYQATVTYTSPLTISQAISLKYDRKREAMEWVGRELAWDRDYWGDRWHAPTTTIEKVPA